MFRNSDGHRRIEAGKHYSCRAVSTNLYAITGSQFLQGAAGIQRLPGFHLLLGSIQLGVCVQKLHLFFIGFHAHNDHIAIAIFGDIDGFFGFTAHLGDSGSVFEVADRNNTRHDISSSLWLYYTIIIPRLQDWPVLDNQNAM